MKKTISGIRGIVGEDFTLKDVLRFANNFSSLIMSKKCVIGSDTRPSGKMIAETASSAIMKNGIDVFDLGIVPTPVVFREARKYGSGIIITSSHNPIIWNGLKFIVNGRGINEHELPKILNEQKTTCTSMGKQEKIKSTYLEDIKKIIGNVDDKLEIAVDIGGGAAKDIAPQLLEDIGCNIHKINQDLETSTRGPDPTVDDLTDLVSASKGKDIGFAYDLDGDRLVVVKDGKKMMPDTTLGLGIAKSISLGYKKFVLSIDSSIAIEQFIKEKGGVVQRSKVGEANVVEQILKTKSQAGGEGSSGGFILPEFNYCRDGILTSGLIASMLHDPYFNEILNFMDGFVQMRQKIHVESRLHDKVMKEVTNSFSKQYSDVITIDGVKGIIDENSWVLVRKSNTEDIIRISAETNKAAKIKQITNDAIGIVKQCYDKVR